MTSQPKTAKEFFELPMREPFGEVVEIGGDGHKVIRPVLEPFEAFMAEPDTILTLYDASDDSEWRLACIKGEYCRVRK